MRRGRWVGLKVGLLAVLAALLTAPAAAQLIDTIEEPFVTKNDTVNERISALKGFRYTILEPEKVTNGGIKLLHGFDTWYLHVVTAKKILVEGEPLDNRGELTFLAIVTKDKRADLEFDTLGGRALFLKGIVVGENADAKIDFYLAQAKKFAAAADSFGILEDSLFMAEPTVPKRRRDYRLMAQNCLFTAEAYEAFLDGGDYGDAAAKFFLTHYMNFSQQVNVYTHPHGLPEFVPPPPEPELGPVQPRKRKKSFWKKLAFWK